MSQRYIGNYNDYINNLGSRRCCNVTPNPITVTGPTGAQGPQGFVGVGATGATGPIGVGRRGPTGPPGGLANVSTNVTPVDPIVTNVNECQVVLNASFYFSTSWSLNVSSSLISNLVFTFENFSVNGIYRFYITNTSGNTLNIGSATSTVLSSGTVPTGVSVLTVNYVDSNTYYITVVEVN